MTAFPIHPTLLPVQLSDKGLRVDAFEAERKEDQGKVRVFCPDVICVL